MHVIVGAGPIGSATARLLASRGERVRVITRSGSGVVYPPPSPASSPVPGAVVASGVSAPPSAASPEPGVGPAIELVAADASDAARLTELCEGAVALYNCANPPYHTWLTDWPPLAASMLQAASASGAVLVTISNLYGYGPVQGPITEHTPLAATHPKLRVRRQMWEDALAAHQAGKVRVTEARASDYVGYKANSVLSDVVLSRTAKGKPAFTFGNPDAPHSWTNVDDVAQTLVTIATDERAWGKAWLVPTAPAASVREAANRANELIGVPPAKVSRIPYAMLWTVGLFSKLVKELRATYYQFRDPFTIDSSLTERTFGLKPTPLDESLRAAALAYRDR